MPEGGNCHSLLTMQNLDLSLIIDISWYLFLFLPCQRGYVQKMIYLGISVYGPREEGGSGKDIPSGEGVVLKIYT